MFPSGERGQVFGHGQEAIPDVTLGDDLGDELPPEDHPQNQGGTPAPEGDLRSLHVRGAPGRTHVPVPAEGVGIMRPPPPDTTDGGDIAPAPSV
jgi:hypothetical protein